MTKTIFVQGATGNTGSAIVNALLQQHAGAAVIKAGFRNPDKAGKLKAAKGVETVKFDIEDASTHAAIHGVDVFVIVPPSTEDRGQVAAKAVRIAKQQGAKFIVGLSVPDAKKDAKILFSRQFAEFEDELKASGIPYTLVRCTIFQDNDVWGLKGLKDHPVYYRPFRADATFAPVAIADIGSAFAAIAGDASTHAGKTYVLTGPESITGNKLAEIFSTVVGTKVTFQEVSDQAAADAMVGQGVPRWQAVGIAELYRFLQDGATEAKAPGDFSKITGKKGTDTLTTLNNAKTAAGL
eukprot:ANDGO_04204.mRNA.1 NAD(P)H azoreductase